MKKLINTTVIVFAVLFAHAQVKDIDNNTYKIVEIGNQEWLQTNLNVSHFRNGDTIIQVTSKGDWAAAGRKKQPVWCYYEFDSETGKKFGKLYNWYAVNDPRGLAPKGTHIPTKKEYTELTDYVGDGNVQGDRTGDRLKAKTGWETADENGSNISGFSAVPNGRINAVQIFWNNEQHFDFWMKNSYGLNQGHVFAMYHSCMGSHVVFEHFQKRSEGFPVRCMKD